MPTDTNDLIKAAKSIKTTGGITEKDIDFLSLVHTVDIESDLVKSNRKSVTLTMTGSGGEVRFASIREFRAYVRAWEQAEALYGQANSSKGKFALLVLLKRTLKKWCDSFIVTQALTSTKASATTRKNEQMIKFRFKGSGRLITMPANAVPSYVKVLRKLLANYNAL